MEMVKMDMRKTELKNKIEELEELKKEENKKFGNRLKEIEEDIKEVNKELKQETETEKTKISFWDIRAIQQQINVMINYAIAEKEAGDNSGNPEMYERKRKLRSSSSLEFEQILIELLQEQNYKIVGLTEDEQKLFFGMKVIE